MSHYHHLTIEEREKLLVLHTNGKSNSDIAREIGRDESTVSRELNRNKQDQKDYSAAGAHENYCIRRRKCGRRKLLEGAELKNKVQELFLEQQWSPEQIANRLAHENSRFRISYNTIYRGIYAGLFDTDAQKRSAGNRGAIRKLRHRGKKRRKEGVTETRGKIVVSNTIHERPAEAESREVIGHWEADTVAGKLGSACLVTLTDRCSRYLLSKKVGNKKAQSVADRMVELFCDVPEGSLKTISPDCGTEFAKHAKVTEALGGVQFYFADPHSPWQRGTNENTNGLLREYFPKSFDFNGCSDDDIALFIEKLNKRPRKCLGWLSPFEVFFGIVLHLT